jgi:acyl-coenzyme A synthetase/AMP-(fatty) acid ligase
LNAGAAWVDRLLGAGDDRAPCLRARGSLTYGELRGGLEGAGRELASHGIGDASTVVVQLPPGFTYVRLLLALWRSGAQVLLLDYRLPPAEVERYLAGRRPEFHLRATAAIDPMAPVRDECQYAVERLAGGAPADVPHRLVQFTSGSTGVPKVIGRTFASLDAELARYDGMEAAVAAGDRVVLLSSHSHTWGLIGGILHALHRGCTLAFPTSPQPQHVLETMAAVDSTVVIGVPIHFELLSTAASARPFPNLRVAVSAGEPIRPETHRRFEDRYGHRIGQVYGTTETGLISGDLAGRHPMTSGRPAGLDVEIREGEVYVRLDETPYLSVTGPPTFRDGWFRTFDRGTLDAGTGTLVVSGRMDTLVAVAGLKVDLLEVEAVLRGHEDVGDVVVLMDDVIEAYVGARERLTADDLLAWARERLAPYKLPRRVSIGRALPRTVTGKVARSREVLRQALTPAPDPA